VGGGLIGIELAVLRSRISYFLSTRKKILGWSFTFWPMIMSILEHHIDLRLETNLVEIISEKDMPKQSSPIKADY
jgi:hypothetical protein